MNSYFGRLEAQTGTLIGGVKRHESSRFESAEDAIAWLETIRDCNLDAGRTLSLCIIVGSDQKPDIPAS